MAKIASELLVERLIDWGVDTIYGLPGDGINGVMEAIRRNSDRIRFILVQHEEAAAFMAVAYAKATGKLGVCLATSGPGGIHLLNGLYDAKLDHHPVLAITGMQESSILGTGYQQEVALDKIFADVAEFNLVVQNPVQLPGVVDSAIRMAYARRGVAHLTIPADIQVAPAGENPYRNVAPALPPHGEPSYSPVTGTPREGDLVEAASILNSAKKPAILAGAGALGASSELLAVADAIGAPVIKTLPGKAAIPDDSDFSVGGIGLLGTKPGEDLIEDCDVLFLVGTNFPYTKHLPAPGSVRVVQLEADPARAGERMPTDVSLIGDTKLGLAALLPHLTRREDRGHLEKYRAEMAKWREKMDDQADAGRDPIVPQYLMAAIDRAATDDAVLTCDSGTIATWAARGWTIRGDREFYLSGTLASMAPGLPYANAIQLAYPGRQVVSLIGDGGFAMLMAEFLTAARYHLPVTIVVNNNNALGQILWEQLELGYPEHEVRFGDPVPDYSAWARACGGFGRKVTKPEDVESAITEALAFDGPSLVDVDVDSNEPPLPGKIELEQAKNFAKAFARGEKNPIAMATTFAKDLLT